MRHSCGLGLTYGAARDVTDGHVQHCTNKQPVDCAAHAEPHTQHTVQHNDTCISILVRILHGPQLSPNHNLPS